ncbi:MAG: AgmX/PglI C-terminal domain-containing protein [Deltaproteobacteria bacterium]
MTQIAQSPFDRSVIEILLAENKFAEALALLSADQAPFDRETSLYALLLRLRLYGPEYCERDIDGLRALTDFNDHEKTLVRRIFLYAFQMAEKANQEEKKWAYQRLLRRLLLGQPLNQPIPFTSKKMPARRIVQLDAAAIIPTSLQKKVKENRRAATIGASRRTTRRLALGFCASCLIMTPLPHLVSRVVPAPTYRPSAAPTPASPDAVSTRVESANPDLRTKTEEEISERFDEAQIKESLTKQLSGLRRAYALWSTKKRNTRGSVLLKLTVDGNGKVVAVDDFDSRLSEAGFLPVVVAEARKWRFPITQAETSEITVPLVFVPQRVEMRRIPGRQEASSPKPGRSVENTELLRIATAQVEPEGVQATIAAGQYDLAKPLEPLSLDYVAQRTIALREEPRFASQAIEEIGKGTRIAVVEVVGDWFKVRTAHSQVTGFVRKEFIVPDVFGR